MANKDLYLPEDILNNILVRLPRKSLSRFRCVSKHWNRLILDPAFNDSRSCEKIFLPGRFCQVIDKCVTGDEYRMVKADSPFEGKQVKVGGTFNGILLLTVENPENLHKKVDIMLYNPLTKVYNQVPGLPPYSLPSNNLLHPMALGFGHGATQDDLKIVTVVLRAVSDDINVQYWNVFSLKNKSWSTAAAKPWSALYWNIFSLKDKSWSTLRAAAKPRHQLLYSVFDTYAGTFVNGSLYWIISERRGIQYNTRYGEVHRSYTDKLILALDVKKKMFSEIKLPEEDIAFDVLGTIKGRLCCVTSLCNINRNPEFYKLMVMNKQGLWETHSNSCLTSLIRETPYDNYRPFTAMGFFDEGKIILKNDKTGKLIVRDLLKDSYERDVHEFEPSAADDRRVILERQAIEYEQSLVSPSDLYQWSGSSFFLND